MIKFNYTDGSKSEITSKQLKEGCKKLQLQYSEDIVNAYANKEQMILYAIEYIKKECSLLDISNPKHCTGSKDPRFIELWIKVEMYIEYIAIMCIGLTDIWALFLNNSFSLGIDENKVLFTNIKDKFTKKHQNHPLTCRIVDKFNEIKDSDEYKYLYHLDNFVKHNNVISTTMKLTICPKIGYFSIKEFIHTGETCSQISLDEFLEKVTKFRLNLVELFKVFL